MQLHQFCGRGRGDALLQFLIPDTEDIAENKRLQSTQTNDGFVLAEQT